MHELFKLVVSHEHLRDLTPTPLLTMLLRELRSDLLISASVDSRCLKHRRCTAVDIWRILSVAKVLAQHLGDERFGLDHSLGAWVVRELRFVARHHVITAVLAIGREVTGLLRTGGL